MYRWLRDEAPVYHNEELGFWAVSRYDDCVEVHRDVATYTSTRACQPRPAPQRRVRRARRADRRSMIMMDPPMHERMRKLVNRAFTPRRIAEWEPVVQRVIGGLLDDARRARTRSTPSTTSPARSRSRSSARSSACPRATGSRSATGPTRCSSSRSATPSPPPRASRRAIALSEYMHALVADKRAAPRPTT